MISFNEKEVSVIGCVLLIFGLIIGAVAVKSGTTLDTLITSEKTFELENKVYRCAKVFELGKDL